MYEQWIDKLIEDLIKDNIILNNNLIVKKYSPREENNTGLRIENHQKNKFLIIDASSVKPFYNKIAEPSFPYEKSLVFAKNACLHYINNWLE